jgi:uncharacterized protein
VTDHSRRLTLDLVHGSYAICRLGPGDALPQWVTQAEFFSVTRTPEELSAVCNVAAVPAGVKAEVSWSMFAVRGPLEFNLTGVLARLAVPLAAAEISIFAISTYDTDYVLVRNADVDRAVRALRAAGHHVSEPTVPAHHSASPDPRRIGPRSSGMSRFTVNPFFACT